jgi:hypothetical protein
MTPKEAFEKCKKENKRIIELEDLISADLDYSYRYAREIIKGRFEKGEDNFSKNSEWSYLYARDVIKGPFEKGEDAISKKPSLSYSYASNIIKGPFEKCHPFILNSDYKNDYIDFLKSINYDLNKISEWLI